MRSTLVHLNSLVERWVRKRFAFPLILLLAAALLWVSEDTYRDTTTTLRGGIELTDARIQTMRLLQLLSDVETAQFAFLVTARPEYLPRYAEAKAALPEVQRAVSRFLLAQGVEGEATTKRVDDFVRRELAQYDRTLELARAGDAAGARALASDDRARGEMMALRSELLRNLALAATQQQRARTSIYDALLVNRVAVGSLTLVALLSLFLFLRQLRAQERERADQQSVLLKEREQLKDEVERRTDRLTQLATHLQSVREDERAHLARELHDELGGFLTASKLDIARARMKTADPPELLVRLERVNDHLNKCIALKRRIIEDLRPSALANLGLTVALQNLCDDMSVSLGIPVKLVAAQFHLSPEAELAVYRFVQEALTNIGKYAAAKQVEVTLKEVDGCAAVEVVDDGVGFDPQASRVGHHGLAGMQFRAQSLGGTMSVDSAPGRGTRVHINFPQSAVEAA